MGEEDIQNLIKVSHAYPVPGSWDEDFAAINCVQETDMQ